MKNKIKIFLVDDDTVFLRLLEIQFQENSHYEIESFTSGEECIESLSKKPDIIILGYILNSVDKAVMNGIEALDKIKAYNTHIPVVILSGQDMIEVAVNCMRHQAFDYVVKSETAFLRLQKIIINIMEVNKLRKRISWYMERM